MVAIPGLCINGMEINPPKIRPSKIKKGMELNHRYTDLLADSSLGIIILPYDP